MGAETSKRKLEEIKGDQGNLAEAGLEDEERPKKAMVYELEVNQKQPEDKLEDYYDEKTGFGLDAGKVREARGEEIDFMKLFCYTRRPVRRSVGRSLAKVQFRPNGWM